MSGTHRRPTPEEISNPKVISPKATAPTAQSVAGVAHPAPAFARPPASLATHPVVTKMTPSARAIPVGRSAPLSVAEYKPATKPNAHPTRIPSPQRIQPTQRSQPLRASRRPLHRVLNQATRRKLGRLTPQVRGRPIQSHLRNSQANSRHPRTTRIPVQRQTPNPIPTTARTMARRSHRRNSRLRQHLQRSQRPPRGQHLLLSRLRLQRNRLLRRQRHPRTKTTTRRRRTRSQQRSRTKRTGLQIRINRPMISCESGAFQEAICGWPRAA